MNHPWGYGETIPEHFTDRQYCSNAGRRKSNNRPNDELIPKPTDVNVGANMTTIAIPKEHPYSSHISRFAMFPSFRSPDDPETGVRASSRPFFNRHVPNAAPEVTLRSKTKGSSCRHEILESPAKSSKKPVKWTGDHGFLTGGKQVYYPTPPKTILPNLKLRDPDLSLSERTSNMLKNLERTHWLTSYQMDYTGSGPANPLKIDDFQERMSSLSGTNPHRTPLRERSFPTFVPSKPKRGLRRRRVSAGSFSAAEDPQTDQDPSQSDAAATESQPREIRAHEETHPGRLSPSGNRGGVAGGKSDLTLGILHKQPSKTCERRGKENHRDQFGESLVQKSASEDFQEAGVERIQGRPLNQSDHERYRRKVTFAGEKSRTELDATDLAKSRNSRFDIKETKDEENATSDADVSSPPSWEGDGLKEGEERRLAASDPGILPRPRPEMSRVAAVGRSGGTTSLLDLLRSFSKSEAHRKFNSSVTHAAVDPRDNVTTGKKHNFFGINCNYIHG